MFALHKRTNMKNYLIAGTVFLGGFLTPDQNIPQPANNCNQGVIINKSYSKATTLDSIMTYYTTNALPGVSVAVYTEKEGWWAGAQGYANLEQKIPMDNCHLQYLQSVSKSFMAVAILQLKEKGKIDLDAPMTKYLPEKYSHYITDAGKVTVRMLLNHTSGVPEYNENPAFVSEVIQHPLDNFTATDCLKSIAGKPLQSTPGTKYKYINTNYLLLSLIGDAITGNHAEYIKKNIFVPLGLTNTYYGTDHGYLKGLNMPESYWDVFNNGVPVNVTGFQQMTVVSSKGDDGIVCTTTDAIKYLKGLMEGKLLQPESQKLLLDFVKDENGRKRYGMGLIHFDVNGIEAYGHGGGGVGAGCGLMYFPSYKTYVFFSTNIGVLIESELVKIKAGGMRDAVLETILQ